MRNKTIRFLITSLILIAILCVIVFSFLAVFMARKSSETINEVGTIYMSSMSEQISMHFGTTMDLRLSQVEALAETTPSGSMEEAVLRETLVYGATARGFESLSLYSRNGDFDMLCGSPVTLVDPGPFLASLRQGEKKIAVGLNSAGERVVLLGVPAVYPMAGEEESIALVGVLPVDYIKNTLSLDEDDSLVYSHIIRQDGSFVIRSSDAYRESYFDRLRATFDEVNGDAEVYIAELEAAMAAREDYSQVLRVSDGMRHMYCTALPYSEWYLVTIMPYGILSESVGQLGNLWLGLVLGSCAIVLMALLFVFAKYFSMTRNQIQELERTREDAVQASKAKSEFLSNMSHDIRTPMNAIVGMTAIATANIDNRQRVENCLKKIALSSRHLLGLINDVLDMSKIESGKMTLNIDQVSLREVMESIVSIVQPQVRAKSQRFDVSIHDISTENVCCDSVRLNQVLLNLLSNAVKFTPEGGAIRVAMFEEPSPVSEEHVRIHIKVKDNGIGMSPEFQEKIFDSFTREDSARVRKTEGTGLGMAITKYIVSAMGGTIEVQSEQGKGTEFHIVLDLEKAMVQEVDMALPKWNMLVVDDDQQLCESVVESLKSIGVNADWTLDGETAVEIVEQRHQAHNDFHIVLLDWKLPGMDGIATAHQIRARLGENIPILLISAYDWGEIEDRAREAGISGFISKPLFKSTLFYGLKPYMESSSLTESPAEKRTNLQGKHILLAEDNELNWEVAQELLGSLGLELEWAENGKICVEKFQQAPVGFYDAILMDIRMPFMDGYEATRTIRGLDRADASLPIIAMTADAFSDDMQRCLACGMNAHIAKPIDVKEVARLLEKHCSKATDQKE